MLPMITEAIRSLRCLHLDIASSMEVAFANAKSLDLLGGPVALKNSWTSFDFCNVAR